MGHSGTDLKLLLNSESSNVSLHSLLKNMLKIHILDLKNRGYFFLNFALFLKCGHFCITRFDIPLFCNILHLEINFGNLY